MNTSSDPPSLPYEGATVVITHRVLKDKHPEYETWLEEITPLAKASPGYLDWHMIRPIPGVVDTYAFIIRFDNEIHLKQWMESSTRTHLIEKVRPLLESDDDFFVRSGLDFWFTPAEAKAKLPVRWKQYVVTWSAIYPLVLLVSFGVTSALRMLNIHSGRLVTTLVVTGLVVYLMVYIVMPRYTRLVHRWLFR